MQHFPDSAINAAETLIKQFEGCRLRAYKDLGGVWTAGWGETAGVGPDTVWTQDECDQRLGDSLSDKAQQIDDLLEADLGTNQAGAILDLAYNIGVHALAGSTLLKDINAGAFGQVAAQFLRWNKVNGQPVAGLTRRRQAEANLWNTPSA